MQQKYLFSTSVFLLVNFVFIACITSPQRIAAATEKAQNAQKAEALAAAAAEQMVFENFWTENPQAFYAVLDENPVPGSFVTVVFLPPLRGGLPEPADGVYKAALYDKNERRLSKPAGVRFFEWDIGEGSAGGGSAEASAATEVAAPRHTLFAAVFSVPSTAESGPARIAITGDAGFSAEIPITIAYKEFAAEIIPLNPSNTSLRTEPDPQKTKEAQQLWAILEREGRDIYTDGPFVPPVAANTRRTSFFGDRRVYQYSTGKTDTAIHAGIDYGVPKGTKVAACANGRVILARPRIVTGNSVILEHLPGLYTIYYHLEQILVREGDLVETSDIIGLSGSTGLSTGPHLHWEIRAATENTDPDILTSKPILDSALTLQKIDDHIEKTMKNDIKRDIKK